MRGTIDLPAGHEASTCDIAFDPPFDTTPAFWWALAIEGPVADPDEYPTASLVVLEWIRDEEQVTGAKLAVSTTSAIQPITLAWIASIPEQVS